MENNLHTKFRLCIPTAHHKQHAWEPGAFKEADEKAKGIELVVAAHSGLCKSEGAPSDFHHAQPVTRTDVLDNQSAWDLHDSVGAGIGGPLSNGFLTFSGQEQGIDRGCSKIYFVTYSVGVLITVHGQIFLHSTITKGVQSCETLKGFGIWKELFLPHIGVCQIRLVEILELFETLDSTTRAYHNTALTKKPMHPMVNIEKSSFRKSLRSSGVLRWVSESQMKERNLLASQ